MTQSRARVEAVTRSGTRGADRPRWASPLATLLLALVVVLGAFASWVSLNSPVDPIPASDLVFVVSMVAYAALGWLITVKGPQNALGWIFLTFPLLLATSALFEEFGLRAALAGSDAAAAMLLTGDVWLAFSGYLLLNGPIFLLFPDGRFPGTRFRWAFWAITAVVLVSMAAYTVSAEPLCAARLDEPDCIRMLDIPLGLVPVEGLRQSAYDVLSIALLLIVGVSLASVIARYRRAAGEVRQQIKWVAWVAIVGAPVLLGLYGGQELLGLPSLGVWNDLPWIAVVSVGLPTAIGIAIFRYRLYEIDRIISRTATYTLLAVVLAAVYAGGVTLAQRILPIQSQFGIVASTLAVAALFNPLRGRVQLAVDRRFNRSRYDAQRVLDDFSARLRDDVDLEQMQAALLNVTLETVQPSHLSLWVREGWLEARRAPESVEHGRNTQAR